MKKLVMIAILLIVSIALYFSLHLNNSEITKSAMGQDKNITNKNTLYVYNNLNKTNHTFEKKTTIPLEKPPFIK